MGLRSFSRVIGAAGARAFTVVGFAVILALMLWVAATALPPSGTAFAQNTTISPVAHVQVEKKFNAVENANVPFHGVGAGLTIHKPSVGNPDVPPEKASVAQIALFTWDAIGRPYAIELGWMVSPAVYGRNDNEPHLFLGTRRPGEPFCEFHGQSFGYPPYEPGKQTVCGFTPLENRQNVWPDTDLTTITPPVVNYGTSNNYGPQTFHIGYYEGNNAWWIQFQDRWIGYINAKWFGEGADRFDFKKAEYAYWYGEVLSSTRNHVPCALEMGNGKFGTEQGSARFEGMFYEKMDRGESKLYYTKSAEPRLAEGDHPKVWSFWNGKELSPNSFSYGGPGAC